MLLLAGLALVLAACGTSSAEEPPTTEAANASGVEAQSVSDTEALSVVVTTTIWGDIVSQVTGDAATVEVLYPVGADPHDYQPSSAQVASMQAADLVVVNGLHLEEGLEDVIESLEAEGANILEVAPLLDPIPFGEGGHAHHDDHEGEEGHEHEEGEHGEEGDHSHDEEGDDSHDEEGEHGEEGDHSHDEEGDHSHDEEGEHSEEEGKHSDEEGEHSDEEGEHSDEEGHKDEDGHDHGHDHGDEDPHVWHDPLRIAVAVELIAEELAALDPTVDWSANADAYADELRALDNEVIALLDSVPDDRRKMVTNHDAFGYLEDRYDFEVVGTVIPSVSTWAEPSSSELADLVETMTDENIDVIFTETIEPTTLAEAVAAEVGAEVAVVELFTGSLGGPGSGGETYIEMIRTNATRISGALS